ncbi:hypothetical protein SAMN05216338_105450 [Bradyrhizobium sp. Rc2d]|nr:hypothetical protein SAMN05216338_105450 [Bradyrhizobium sp. Rc2d]
MMQRKALPPRSRLYDSEAMLILIDNPERRAELISRVRARIDCEIEEVSEALCEGRPATRALRLLETLTKILAELEVQK